MNVVDHLESEHMFGSRKALANAAGRSLSSVFDWKTNNRIPSEAIENILNNAHKYGVHGLSIADFFPAAANAAVKKRAPKKAGRRAA